MKKIIVATVTMLCAALCYADSVPDTETLAKALHRRVTIWTTPAGRQVEIGHCRNARMGCYSRIRMFATWINESAQKYTLDPWILAGMAVHESGLNPLAKGKAGEGGIYQLHPRGVGRNVVYVQSESYRMRCNRQMGACQAEVIERAAQTLRRGLDTCGQKTPSALGYYNSGRCEATPYSRRVLQQVQFLKNI